MTSGVPPAIRDEHRKVWQPVEREPWREVIGPPECPLFYRYTLRPFKERRHENAACRWKLMVHHFLPNADDRAVHDHPRPFWTFVLWGTYDDMRLCELCDGLGYIVPNHRAICPDCEATGVRLRERMRPGMLRYRSATHRHRTRVGPRGCWTVVLMGPLRRRWGFWLPTSRGPRWMYWKVHERVFGFGMRCEEGDT